MQGLAVVCSEEEGQTGEGTHCGGKNKDSGPRGVLGSSRKCFLERLCLSWALKDEEVFTRLIWAFLVDGAKEQK